jgi:hypothetical protein
MPNWCNNQITITGPNSVIDKIEKIVDEKQETEGLLQFMYPMPEGLKDTTADMSEDKEMIKKYGYSDWYGWACDNWGTKWDLCEFYGVDRQYLTETSEGESTISFAFDSAWAPPVGAYENFLANNEDCSLKATYYEPGCDFMGIWQDYDDKCYTISDTAPDGSKDDFWDTDEGAELDDMFGITESMADWEAEQEAEKEDVTEYVKGKAMNIGEDA